jgi:4-amino-4-deoxy-L-arabinose transferase-like glycosyltransferase
LIPNPSRLEWAAVAALLLVLFAATAFEAWTLGPTVDEPSHILSSWLWWRGRDRLYPRDVPPLIKIVGGSGMFLRKLPVPDDLGKPGDTRSEWTEAAALFGRLDPAQLQPFLFRARLPLVLFPLLGAVVLWLWARELFGVPAGLTVAALWAMCPTVLGHSALFKNDVAASAMYLLCWYSVWRFWRKPAALAAALVGLTAALALLSKFSMLFVLPGALAVLATRALVLRRPFAVLLWPALAAACAWLATAAAWQFELRFPPPLTDPELPRWFVAAASVLRFVPVPEAAWTGVLSLLKADAHPVPVYLLGQVYPEGNRAYFVAATLLKMSAPVLVLLAAGLYVTLRRIRELRAADLFWLVPGFLYFTLASLSSLHLGVRLVMPAWAFFFLLAGAAIPVLSRRWTAAALACAFLLTATAYPYGISYFNPWAGRPWNRLEYLADSNIDWGQSLGEAGRYARSHGIERIHLAYFGFDRQERYFAPGQVIAVPVPWDATSDVERLQPEKGWYAISATLLPGHLFLPRYRNYFAEFLRRRPQAVAGGSIFIYRID